MGLALGMALAFAPMPGHGPRTGHGAGTGHGLALGMALAFAARALLWNDYHKNCQTKIAWPPLALNKTTHIGAETLTFWGRPRSKSYQNDRPYCQMRSQVTLGQQEHHLSLLRARSCAAHHQ